MVSNDQEWSFGDWMIYSLSHRCSIRGNNKRLLFVFLCVRSEGWREENSYIMKPWSSFFLSQKRSLSSNYYKYITKIKYILHCGSFYIVFSYGKKSLIWFWKGSFFLLHKKSNAWICSDHKIVKHCRSVRNEKQKSPFAALAQPHSPTTQPLKKFWVFWFLVFGVFFLVSNLYYSGSGQFHNNRWHFASNRKIPKYR